MLDPFPPAPEWEESQAGQAGDLSDRQAAAPGVLGCETRSRQPAPVGMVQGLPCLLPFILCSFAFCLFIYCFAVISSFLEKGSVFFSLDLCVHLHISSA